LPGSSGEKLCPICDSPLQPGSRKCGFCGTDLSIFDMGPEKPEPIQPTAPVRKPSIDARVREVLSAPAKPEPAPEPVKVPEPVKEVPPPAVEPERPVEEVPKPEPAPEPPKAAPPPQPQPQAQAQAAPVSEYFDCPECGAKVEIHASSCPGCGVMFADEGAEMFQCPACDTLVNIDSKSCPGCGAMFVESEEEVAVQEPAAKPDVEIEAPISEVAQAREEPSPMEPTESETVTAAEPSQDVPAWKKGLGWLKKLKKEPEPTAEPPVESPTPSSMAEPRRVPEPEFERKPPQPQHQTQPQPQYQPQYQPPPQQYRPPAEPQPTPQRPSPVREVAPPVITGGKDKGKELARMVAEMKPLLTLANEKDIDITESKRLIDAAAEAGRDRQLEKALEHVNRSKGILMRKIDDHLASAISQLKEETAVARSLGGDVSRALTYVKEIEKAKTAGDVEAAFVYADKVSNELLPITGRYKEARNRTASLRALVSDCETLIIDTKEARTALSEASKAFDANDFDKVEMLVKQATDRLYRAIPDRINEEMHAAKAQLIEAKMKNVNTTPMITILKSVRTLMKAGDYQQALREMKEFKEQMRKVM
jgi:cellobiose-specific phosphotransferase system component IIA